MFDFASNSEPFTVTVFIEVVNDNAPTLLPGGDVPEFIAYFTEGQDYLGGPVPVPVALPQIRDVDSGVNTLTSARVELGKGNNKKCRVLT